MALTQDQNIPERPKISEPWTVKRLFSSPVIGTIAKAFVNPFHILLGFAVLIMGIVELSGGDISWTFVGFSALLFVGGEIGKYKFVEKEKKDKPKK